MQPLTSLQQDRIARFLPAFRRYLDNAEQDTLAQKARQDLYAQILSPVALRQMTEFEFGQVISSLWASRLWGNKGYLVERLLQENNLDLLAAQLNDLLYGDSDLALRFDAFRREVKGMGTAMITELLAFAYPDSCGLWNDTVRQALEILGFRDGLPILRKSQLTGAEYAQFNALLKTIQAQLAEHGLDDIDLLGIYNFLYTVNELGQALVEPEPSRPPKPLAADDFGHDELIDQLVALGNWLGFQAEKEKPIAKGAVVDAIWKARIANLGVVTYVFEVQRRGSIDSLIVNLQKAQNNPTVQRLIIVATPKKIDAIRQEIAALPESFRKSVSYMEVDEVIRSAQLIGELSSIIGKLNLVRDEYVHD